VSHVHSFVLAYQEDATEAAFVTSALLLYFLPPLVARLPLSVRIDDPSESKNLQTQIAGQGTNNGSM